jgi:hypothetical protein
LYGAVFWKMSVRRVLFVGGSALLEEAATHLSKNRHLGLKLIGYVSDAENPPAGAKVTVRRQIDEALYHRRQFGNPVQGVTDIDARGEACMGGTAMDHFTQQYGVFDVDADERSCRNCRFHHEAHTLVGDIRYGRPHGRRIRA